MRVRKPSGASAQAIAADDAATRIVGWVLLVPRVVFVLLALVVLSDPLVWAGLKRVVWPEEFRAGGRL
jgi:hypothetical protein